MNWDAYFPAVRDKIIETHLIQVVDLYNRLVEMGTTLLPDENGWRFAFSSILALNQKDYSTALSFANQAMQIDENWKFVHNAASCCMELMSRHEC